MTTTKTVLTNLTHGNTYSFVYDSMQIAVISGKRRRNALKLHLSTLSFASWVDAARAATAWREANPRAPRRAA